MDTLWFHGLLLILIFFITSFISFLLGCCFFYFIWFTTRVSWLSHLNDSACSIIFLLFNISSKYSLHIETISVSPLTAFPYLSLQYIGICWYLLIGLRSPNFSDYLRFSSFYLSFIFSFSLSKCFELVFFVFRICFCSYRFFCNHFCPYLGSFNFYWHSSSNQSFRLVFTCILYIPLLHYALSA